MTDMTIRALGADELERFLSYRGRDVHGVGLAHRRSFLDTAAQRHYRPEWTWVAERGGEVVARAAYWGFPDSTHPLALDWFDPGDGPDRIEVGARLLATADSVLRTAGGERPEYHLFLPPHWRDDAEVRAAGEDRLSAAGAAGREPFVERWNYRWTAGEDPAPVRTGRLELRPAGDREVLDALRRISAGTLDAHTRREIARQGVDGAAQNILDGMRELPGPPDWWRLGYTADGALAGLVMPGRNYTTPIIGFVGVVPEERGHGYAGDLLAEGTALLIAEGAERIMADTDQGNAPMAAAFTKAGYRIRQTRIVMASP
jgi:ribosomal protein S18 acetylase RimI-like enzyme